MLALTPNWEWSSEDYTYFNAKPVSLSKRYYKVIRSENVNNFDCYVVELSLNSEPIQYFWIDKKSRFLVKMVPANNKKYYVVLDKITSLDKKA